MEFKLTKHYQYSKKCKDGKRRNYLLYFLNDVQILKHKISFDENDEKGFDRHTYFYNEYILNGKLHQTRTTNCRCGALPTGKTKEIYRPVSRLKLQELQVPNDLKISIDEEI
jgi:hypothetical protein